MKKTTLLLTVTAFLTAPALAQEVIPATQEDLKSFEKSVIQREQIQKPEQRAAERAKIERPKIDRPEIQHERHKIEELAKHEKEHMLKSEQRAQKQADHEARKKQKEKLKNDKKQDASAGAGPTNPRNVRESVKGSKKSKNK